MLLHPAWISSAKAIALSAPAHLGPRLKPKASGRTVYLGLLVQRKFSPLFLVSLVASLGLTNLYSVEEKA